MDTKPRNQLARFLKRLLSVTLIAFCLGAQAHAKDPAIVSLFGDSISFGYLNSGNPGGTKGDGRLSFGVSTILLRDILNASNRASQVANLGWGGSPSGPSANSNVGVGNGVDRINSDLDYIKNTYAGSKYFVLIMYGTNDHGYGIPPSTTGFNYKVMMDRAVAKGVTVLASTIPPCTGICSKSPSDLSSVNSNIISAVNSRISQGKDVYFVDNHAALSPNWGSWTVEGLHPNQAGYGVIAQNWFDKALAGLIPPSGSIAPIINFLLDEEPAPPPPEP